MNDMSEGAMRNEYIDAIDESEAVIVALVDALRDCLKHLDELRKESGRCVEWGEEDPFRRGEWFCETEITQMEAARAAIAKADARKRG